MNRRFGCLCVVLALSTGASEIDRARFDAMRADIARLRVELQEIRGREVGILDTIERLAAERRLREAELAQIGMRMTATERALEEGRARLARIGERRTTTQRYLEFRLRETYKRGAGQTLRRVLTAGGAEGTRSIEGLRYSAWLAQRDADAIREFRRQRDEIERGRADLEARRAELELDRREAREARDASRRATSRRRRLLEDIRGDAQKREAALSELQDASAELARVLEGVRAERTVAPLEIAKFRGLLDRPAPGRVRVGFGTTIHERFRTRVPHPGLDIEAPAGTGFHSVFEGTVVFASWLRGYGLTAIVDHGGDVMSIYAHASVLLVETGEAVARGHRLGLVGDTGSLKGPYLYFEMREQGKPVDPALWLRGE